MSQMKKSLAQLKQEYVEYYTDCPVQKYAAMYIGKNEDTIIRWRSVDQSFADRVQKAKAIFIRKKLLKTKSEFALERLEKEVFGKSELLDVVSTKQQAVADINNAESVRMREEFTEFMMQKTRV